MFTALFLPLVFYLPTVFAHGFMGGFAVDGQQYPANVPNNYKGPSPVRLVNDIGPVKGANNPDIVCGLSAQKAEMVVPAKPGSTVSFKWDGGGNQNWPHLIGPVMTYMASCGSTPCDQFDPTGAKWFKIDQAGRRPDGKWFQSNFQEGNDYSLTLPNDLPSGGYLIRNEIIALHNGGSMGGAEFYPSCTQVMINGGGNGSPSPTVSFPGAYSDSDPGIMDPNVYDTSAPYTFPGGPVSNLAAGGDATAPSPPPSAPSPSGTSNGGGSYYPPPAGGAGSAPAPAPTQNQGGPVQNTSGGPNHGTCRLTRKKPNANQPRHYSRAMRRIMNFPGTF